MQNDEIKEESTGVNWLDDEIKSMPQANGDFEKLPSVWFEENKLQTIRVDATQPFRKWEDKENDKTKAIIPCVAKVDGVFQKANWWLNIKNPNSIRTMKLMSRKRKHINI